MEIVLENKTFNQLDVAVLYEVLKLRVDVFVVEQKCPYPELDGYDTAVGTCHFMGRNPADGELAAYLRILPPGMVFQEVCLGRFLVASAYRKQQVGQEMLKQAILQVTRKWPGQNIRISAQVYLRKFYESHGFKAISGDYVEDGIPHVDMIKDDL